MLIFNKYFKNVEVVMLCERQIIINSLRIGATYYILLLLPIYAYCLTNLFTEQMNEYEMIVKLH